MEVLSALEVKMELQQLFEEVREELASTLEVEAQFNLTGDLLNTFNAFLEKNDLVEDSKISECIGTHFWDQFYKTYPDASEKWIAFCKETKQVMVSKITLDELNRRTKQILDIVEYRIDHLVEYAFKKVTKK